MNLTMQKIKGRRSDFLLMIKFVCINFLAFLHSSLVRKAKRRREEKNMTEKYMRKKGKEELSSKPLSINIREVKRKKKVECLKAKKKCRLIRRQTQLMLHAGIEALFGRNRDGHRRRHLFQRLRQHTHKDEHDDLARFFSEKPHLEKILSHGSTFGFAAMQGWRSSMEDRNKHLIPLDNQSWKLWSYFAIFDGHNGRRGENRTTPLL